MSEGKGNNVSDRETPTDVLKRMIEFAASANSIEELPVPGTYAKEYGDSVREDIDGENVDAFLHGAALVNLLIQEAILRVTTIAQNVEAETAPAKVYQQGMNDGALQVAGIIGSVVDGLINSMIDTPLIDRAFNGIVNNF